MKIVSWNVNSLGARLPRVLELLERHAPEIVCLQETKCTAEAFPTAELERAGYHAAHHSAGRWAGVAILARSELALLETIRGLRGEPAAEEARWIEVQVDGLRVASVYVPNGRSLDSPEFPRKLAFLDAVAERVGEAGSGPWCVCGDLNVTRDDRDVYDPEQFIGSTHVTAEERSRLERILSAGALRDAYREVHPDEVGFTWWDYRAGHFHRKLGLRIDYTLLSASLAEGVRACGIDRDFRKGTKPSDHAPLLTELFFANA